MIGPRSCFGMEPGFLFYFLILEHGILLSHIPLVLLQAEASKSSFCVPWPGIVESTCSLRLLVWVDTGERKQAGSIQCFVFACVVTVQKRSGF